MQILDNPYLAYTYGSEVYKLMSASGRSSDYLYFDGTSYGVLDEAVTVNVGDVMTFNYLSNDGDSGYIFRTSSGRFLREWTDGTVYFNDILKVDGVEQVSLSSTFPDDGALHSLEITFEVSTTIDTFMMRADLSGDAGVGLFSDLVITDSAGNIKLDCRIDQKGSDTQKNYAESSTPVTLWGVDHDTDWYYYQSSTGYYISYFDGSILNPDAELAVSSLSDETMLTDETVLD